MALLSVPALDPLLQALSARTGDDALVHLERLPARAARFAEPCQPLPDALRERLQTHGIDELWTHQAAALDLLAERRSIVIASGTASGKSLCYQLPIAAAVGDREDPGTALLLFPTKALAQDQLRSFGALDPPGLVASTYDGDTAPERRTWVRRHANVLLTNPEMLHSALLPHHGRWATYLMRLRYIVVDELHVLRGVFGTHVAHLLRRLRRVCALYGASPTFVFSSATIGDPARLAGSLSGLPVTPILDDGSPRGERLVALWNPPMVDAGSGARVSPNAVTADLVAELVQGGHRTLAFCRSRRGTEVVAADVVRRHPTLRGKVRPYRGGYLATERRDVEAELFGGRLRGVVATSALELGVDVGGLDACVLNGFPGTIASMWQQVGRAGREGQQSLAVLVAGSDQLDQYLMAHPEEVFTRRPEPAVVNQSNPFVLDPHLACAAFEHPLGHDDAAYWGDDLDDGIRRLVLDDRLRLRHHRVGRGFDQRAVWSGRGYPSRGVGLRSGSADEVRIAQADGTIIGTVDRSRACSTVHPGAVYLHQGQPWRVRSLDLDDGAAIVEVADGGDYTQARSDSSIRILGADDRRAVGRTALALGPVEVTSRVTGYQRRDVFSGEVLETVELDLPPAELVTRGFWWTFGPAVIDAAGVSARALPGTLHAVEHAAIAMLPLFTICDRWDVGGVSTAWLPETGSPTIVIHDAYPGGAGIAELGFEAADRHLVATLEVLEACACADGCPSCVQSPKCGNLNEPLDKHGAIRLLHVVLDP
ncbi:MAG: helicase/secretion neighborhood putative DEAH-box helicase [Acidimicrobiales bacterium]|nr:helicase/secretion neighborhood putative DEAH-box helicase [Acidimicrobiales bacterium]